MKIQIKTTAWITGLLLVSSLANAQQEINSSTFGTLEARVLGPGTMSGRIAAIEGVNAEQGKTLYVGTAGGGIWKSTNAGASFKPIFDKYCQSIGAIAIDQKNKTGVVFLFNSVCDYADEAVFRFFQEWDCYHHNQSLKI